MNRNQDMARGQGGMEGWKPTFHRSLTRREVPSARRKLNLMKFGSSAMGKAMDIACPKKFLVVSFDQTFLFMLFTYYFGNRFLKPVTSGKAVVTRGEHKGRGKSVMADTQIGTPFLVFPFSRFRLSIVTGILVRLVITELSCEMQKKKSVDG